MTKTSISVASSPASFRRKLRAWYSIHGRHELPWRLTRDPYAILVSEVMLQQTQVDRVLPYYAAWLDRWPTFEALAAVPASEAIREWRGLGYNRRALNLHRLAVEVANRHGGSLPTDPRVLLALPGIGAYTASAIRCFSREERVVVADTNIARVLARARLGVAAHRDVALAAIFSAGEELLPAHNARDHNLALMDLGATICQSRSPQCERCPVATACRWRAAGYPASESKAVRLPKFETTTRFARGRIIDALREQPATEAELAGILPEPHRERISAYVRALAGEGLVVQRPDETWSLPES